MEWACSTEILSYQAGVRASEQWADYREIMKNDLLKFAVLLVLVAAVIGATFTPKSLPPALADGAGRQPDVLKLPAPELIGGPWINTPDGKALNFASRRAPILAALPLML